MGWIRQGQVVTFPGYNRGNFFCSSSCPKVNQAPASSAIHRSRHITTLKSRISNNYLIQSNSLYPPQYKQRHHIGRSIKQLLQPPPNMAPSPPYPLHESIADRLDPTYKAFYNTHLIDKQVVHHQPIDASRASGTLIPGAGPLLPISHTMDLTIPRKETQGPYIPIRVFFPRGPVPVKGWPLCFWFHGGGWVLGNIDTENVIATNLCNRVECVVITVDYR